MSAVVNMWIVGAEPGGEYYEHLVEAYSEQFTSMNYYRMCPDGDFVENELRKQITSAYHGKHADPIFRHVKQFLHRDGFLKKKSL